MKHFMCAKLSANAKFVVNNCPSTGSTMRTAMNRSRRCFSFLTGEGG
jgi:hypothetical protein